MEVLLLLMALAAPISSIKQHEGRAHFHPKEPRQLPNSPVQGLGVLTTPAPVATTPFTQSTLPTISSYVFPTTVIQEPIATVCPDTPASSAIFPVVPMSLLGANKTQGSITNSSSYMPVRVNATALLPNGSTTVFLSTSRARVPPTTSATPPPTEPGGADTARIVLDKNGCQTLYSAKTTTWCSTTVQRAGMIPVPVTDCGQLVTFSSQRLDACSTMAGSSFSSPSLSPAEANEPMAFYAAHWYDLIQNPVPNVVQVQDCLPRSSEWDCVTSSESWDVVTVTSTSTGTSVASFSGLAVVTSGTANFICDQSSSARRGQCSDYIGANSDCAGDDANYENLVTRLVDQNHSDHSADFNGRGNRDEDSNLGWWFIGFHKTSKLMSNAIPKIPT
ncbi:hypothetical protein AYO20_00454 [Fonsecaea nubica]|uniref:Uncharacterized protein n=1 Tax=Fonsecaea nubica TaxID=856822 RepID=A0A178DE32_9EURO|nr:hypothetical protein AYO20_00454 [Fonsecaea nubica]OAL40036.1 hypothetical protein AYO20_00454 [Fonsecaea nubica]